MKTTTSHSPIVRERALSARLKRWSANATIGLGAIGVFLTAAAVLGAMVLVFGAAGRLIVRWAEYYPK
jgi:hypothetical protein